MALLYRNQGKYELAEALYKEVLALRTARLGPDHLHTVATKDNLAALELAQGQTDVSEELCKDVLAVRTAKLGPNHPDTLASQHRLALLYMAQGKSDLAETLVKEVVMSRTAKLGADHPDTLRSLSDLAVLYLRQEKYALAEMQYKEILAIQSMKLGANHPDTLSSQSGLAVVYRCMKKPEQAIPLLEEAIKRSRANNSPLTMGMQAELGAIYCDAGRFADAITQLEEVQAKSREDPELAWIGNALLTAYVGVGKKAAVVALALQQARVARASSRRQSGARRRAGPPVRHLWKFKSMPTLSPCCWPTMRDWHRTKFKFRTRRKTCGCAMLLRGWCNYTTFGANPTRQGGGG